MGSGGTTGDCGAPSDPSIATAKCGDTVIYGGTLYECISQEVGQQGEASGCGVSGVRCHQINPDDVAWGTTAWDPIQDCD